jgi:hypothetical protein
MLLLLIGSLHATTHPPHHKPQVRDCYPPLQPPPVSTSL